jgi:hypothetical protein
MPTYSFRNIETDEVFDRFMKISEREQYLTDNPTFETVMTAPNVTGELTSRMKPEQGFRDILKEIKRKTNKVWTPSTINTF